MSPPTEQLIRDYLNRLSVAARGQLLPDDRRALVDRTREFIERKASPAGPPTAVEVARLLSGLGDPAGLVSQERQRLATLRGETLEPASRWRLRRVLRGEPGKVRGASWHWPVQPGSRADLQLTLIDGGGGTGPDAVDSGAADPSAAGPDAASTVRARWPALAAGVAARPVGQVGSGHKTTVQQDEDQHDAMQSAPEQVANGHTVLNANAVTAAPDPTAPDPTAPDPTAPDPTAPDPTAPDAMAPDTMASDPTPPGPMPAAATRLSIWQLATSAAPRPSRTRQRLRRVAAWSHRNKLEAAAIVLLGVGGVIFPPVWLLGVLVALASRLWDYRDKWLGLGLPVLLTMMGTAIGLAVGSRSSFGHGIHDSWAFAVDVSRATALLSACYLGWRAARGPRPPAVPPWDKPHRVA